MTDHSAYLDRRHPVSCWVQLKFIHAERPHPEIGPAVHRLVAGAVVKIVAVVKMCILAVILIVVVGGVYW